MRDAYQYIFRFCCDPGFNDVEETEALLRLVQEAQIDDVCVVRKGDDQIGNSGADIANHHAADHQQRHASELPARQQDQAHGEHGAAEGRRNHCRRVQDDALSKGENHHQCDKELGTGRDAQHEGTGDRVSEEGLQQVSRHRKSAA